MVEPVNPKNSLQFSKKKCSRIRILFWIILVTCLLRVTQAAAVPEDAFPNGESHSRVFYSEMFGKKRRTSSFGHQGFGLLRKSTPAHSVPNPYGPLSSGTTLKAQRPYPGDRQATSTSYNPDMFHHEQTRMYATMGAGHQGGDHHYTKVGDIKGIFFYQIGQVFKHLQPRLDDDFADKINYFYTTTLLSAFAFLVAAKQYIGTPLQCWVPATFTDSMEQYTENYCWVQSTYWLPMEEEIPTDLHERTDKLIGYYQWVPFILGIEAIIFFLPCLVWRGFLYWHSGCNLQGLVQMASDARLMDPVLQQRTINTIARHLEDEFEISADGHKDGMSCSPCIAMIGRRCGYIVCILYILTKMLYAANICFQFILLNAILGSKDLLFGFHLLQDLMNKLHWDETGMFPRVTLCDFDVRVLGNIHRHTVQCVIMINMFNEKIFLFLWFWYFAVGAVTLLNLVYWLIVLIFPGKSIDFVARYLRGSFDIPVKQLGDKSTLKKFVLQFVKPDGILMLRMLSSHAGEIITSDVILKLWNDFNHERGPSSYFVHPQHAASALLDENIIANQMNC